MFLEILTDALKNAVLITGLVVIMMMLIELCNIESKGRFLSTLGKSRIGGVIAGATLGIIPGCMGGFATVSLYTHGMLSFGALVAMMIASSGDEAFVMLAAFPKDALWIGAILFGVGIITGIIVDIAVKKKPAVNCDAEYTVHDADRCEHPHEDDGHRHGRHLTWKRALLFAGVAIFIAALVTGHLEHDHGAEETVHAAGSINLLSEDWMNIMFAVLSLAVLAVLILGSDHFVEEHLWHHIVVKHVPRIFAWTFGVLLLLEAGLHYFDISSWISDNTALMILLATAIGIIPESGPHMIFVTLYASGIIPLPVLLASCISQDGHASLPLIAESKGGFVKAKIINCIAALLIGFTAMLFF